MIEEVQILTWMDIVLMDIENTSTEPKSCSLLSVTPNYIRCIYKVRSPNNSRKGHSEHLGHISETTSDVFGLFTM